MCITIVTVKVII